MSALSLVLTAVILWGPTLLFLTALVPLQPEQPALHLVTATGLMLLIGRVLRILLFIPLAPAAEGRHRIVPRYPSAAVLAGAMGTGLWLYAFWATHEGWVPQAWLAVFVGLGSWVTARRYRRLRLWEGWLAMEGDRLVVHTPDLAYRVSLGATRAFRRKADGSVLIVTPQRVNDTLIVPRDAQGRYWVDGAEGLIGQIEGFVDIQEVKSLLVLPQGDP
ncbi:MAG: hypothetical protein H6741_02705 [Alphaproteobacteria bacterium]|nr:hypothetical protein [Alphaproteobacteria bacterium]MCB9791615.1 hypothetical protein [Alphaproteobacteria bacterium]